VTTIITMPAYKAARTIEKTYRFDSQLLIRAVVLGFRIGELYRARRDRDRLRQEFVERENALGL